MSRLKNKIALVTAAGQGIGRASAELFAQGGRAGHCGGYQRRDTRRP